MSIKKKKNNNLNQLSPKKQKKKTQKAADYAYTYCSVTKIDLKLNLIVKNFSSFYFNSMRKLF